MLIIIQVSDDAIPPLKMPTKIKAKTQSDIRTFPCYLLALSTQTISSIKSLPPPTTSSALTTDTSPQAPASYPSPSPCLSQRSAFHAPAQSPPSPSLSLALVPARAQSFQIWQRISCHPNTARRHTLTFYKDHPSRARFCCRSLGAQGRWSLRCCGRKSWTAWVRVRGCDFLGGSSWGVEARRLRMNQKRKRRMRGFGSGGRMMRWEDCSGKVMSGRSKIEVGGRTSRRVR